MLCPYCGGQTKVTNSRSHNKNQGVWRRRQCKNCQAVWTTTENYDLTSTHRVSYSPSEPPLAFSRDVLFESIKDSLQHRKTATADATELTSTIIGKVLTLKHSELPVSVIKRTAHQTLQAFDPTAAAVYRAKYLQ